MKNILAFAGSNSRNSINKQLVVYAASHISEAEVTVLDLNDFDLPMYSIDLEGLEGIPNHAAVFLEHIRAADGILLSLAEHNGAYASVFKNLFDWMSRIDGKLWSEKPMLLMATSPGGRGGSSVLEIANNRFPYMGGNVVSTFSLPSFQKNFSETGISDTELEQKFLKAIEVFKNSMTK